MYSDILMSGGRRFVTTMVNSEDSDTLAEVGVVLYLEDLKEVSQQTNDAVKYVCSHKVLDSRVRIKHVLNEGDSRTRETYLRCEVEELVDDDETDEESSEVSQLEAAVRDSLRDVADMQDQGKEDVRIAASLSWIHAVDARRRHERRRWVVSFSNSRPFSPM